ncbi:MAG TPA: type II secretion system protein GspK [Usitatibacteraceae bacterium]|nr:type II secretion system protein GspK [Usitatibacteraceae bacterium]
MRTSAGRERGIALVLVIWVVTLLLVIAGSFLYAMRTDARAARNAALIARGDAIAQAAVARALLELFKPQGGPLVWKRDGAPREWSFDGAAVAVSFADESAKIDINTANNELLKGLFRFAGMGEDEAAKLLDAVLDWRDQDSLKRPNGAEEPDYAQAGLMGRPANHPFLSTEELQLVLGMRPEVFQRIAPMITVYSRQAGVNPHLAQRSVLLAVPAVTPEQVDAFLAERESARLEQRVPPIFSAAGSYASYAQVAAVTVRADVSLDEGIHVSREAVAMLTPQYPRRPQAFLAWREVSRDRDAKTAAGPEQPVGR